MPDRSIALFRGINVGAAKRIGMAELRAVFEGLGHRDVATLLNSGNVVFTAAKARSGDTAARIEAAVEAELGVRSRVTVLTSKELSEAVRDNPFVRVATNPSRLLLVAFRDPQARKEAVPLFEKIWKPEALAMGRSLAYAWCPDGIVDSALWKALNGRLGDRVTSRNLATMTKILARCQS